MYVHLNLANFVLEIVERRMLMWKFVSRRTVSY